MDPQTFHKLALAEVDAVHRMAFHLARSHHEAEDLVQETYLRAIKAADRFALGSYGIRPWLFKILHNVLHTRRAKHRRGQDALQRLQDATTEPAAAPPNASPVAPAGALGDAARPAGAVNWDAVDERLCRAVRSLPVPHRMVFLMSAVEDLKYREIADIMDVPVGTVMSRLCRARAALARQLGDLAAEHNMNRARGLRRPVPAGTANH